MKPTKIAHVLLLCLPFSVSAAGDPVKLQIDQTRALMPDMSAYFYVYDADGAAVNGIVASQLEADVGGYRADVRSVTNFAAADEGVGYIFLVDISKSLHSERFTQLKAALETWVDALAEKDRAALITTGNNVRIAVDFTADKTVLKPKIAALAPTDNSTRLHDALIQALDMGRRADADLPSRRAIVTLSDGLDDVAGGQTRAEVLARLQEDRIPIYAIGFANPPMTPKKDEGLKSLGAIAHASGGEYLAAGGEILSGSHATLRARIRDVWVAKIVCAPCARDGREYPLQLTLKAGTRLLTAQQNVRLLAGVTPLAPAVDGTSATPLGETTALKLPWGLHWGVYAAAAVIVLLLLLILVLRATRGKKAPRVVENAMPMDPPTAKEVDRPVIATVDTEPVLSKPLPPRCKITLTVVSGAQRGQEWSVEVGQETTLGRSPQCDVVIDNDEEISSRHCIMSYTQGTVFVQDKGSTNGTLVNGVPIVARHALANNDLILLGRTEMRMSLEKAGR